MLKYLSLAVLVAAVVSCGEEYDVDGSDETITQVSSAIQFNGHDYLFFHQPASGDGARFVGCPGPSYRLATISSAAENEFIRAEAARHGGGNWWIGYSDRLQENVWRWDSGEPVGYTNWNLPTEPNNWNNNEDCTLISSSTGTWWDAACNSGSVLNRFVCESGATIPGSSTAFTYNANDTASATRNVFQWAISLPRNTKITIGTCGVNGGDHDGDTFLRFRNPFGTELAFSDDACGGSRASNLTYLVPADGTYQIHAGCYDDKECWGAVGIQLLAPSGS